MKSKWIASVIIVILLLAVIVYFVFDSSPPGRDSKSRKTDDIDVAPSRTPFRANVLKTKYSFQPGDM